MDAFLSLTPVCRVSSEDKPQDSESNLLDASISQMAQKTGCEDVTESPFREEVVMLTSNCLSRRLLKPWILCVLLIALAATAENHAPQEVKIGEWTITEDWSGRPPGLWHFPTQFTATTCPSKQPILFLLDDQTVRFWFASEDNEVQVPEDAQRLDVP